MGFREPQDPTLVEQSDVFPEYERDPAAAAVEQVGGFRRDGACRVPQDVGGQKTCAGDRQRGQFDPGADQGPQ